MDIIIDLETLDTKSSTCITSIACVVFDMDEYKSVQELESQSLHIKLNWLEQSDMGRTMSNDTIEFWKKPENAEAFSQCVEPKPDDVSIKELPKLLENFLTTHFKDNTIRFVYSRGNVFDLGILENLYDQLGEKLPYPWWGYRDVRTEIDSIMRHLDNEHEFNGYVRGLEIDGLVKHNSVHDCIRDIYQMQMAHYQLNERLEKCYE